MAISLERVVLELCGPPDHSVSFHSHSIHGHVVDKEDVAMVVDEIVGLARASLKVCSPGYSDYMMPLATLATSFRCRFQQHDVIADLDETIVLYRRVLGIPLGRPTVDIPQLPPSPHMY